MAFWRWCCTVMLISGLWTSGMAWAADQEALSAEGTLTSVDLNQENPSITLLRSDGTSLVLQLGRFGELESLAVGAKIKLRYSQQNGTNAVESMEITSPASTGSGSSATSSSASTEQSSASSQTTEESKKTTPPATGKQEKQDKQEKKSGKKWW